MPENKYQPLTPTTPPAAQPEPAPSETMPRSGTPSRRGSGQETVTEQVATRRTGQPAVPPQADDRPTPAPRSITISGP
jgi:hypothetical protein